jgi:UDP-N-acetylmuramoyl-tripeptide--D-alanyl-D-alanine ligase
MKTIFSVSASPAGIAAWSGGCLRGHSDTAVSAACTDSREAGPGVMFCAIRGERADGHAYIASAYAAGSRCFLCEHCPTEAEIGTMYPDACFICVPDTVAALPPLAAGFRSEYLRGMRVIAVTGSVGKTTTKGLCAAVLRTALPTFCREGNYNSVIGMPLCVPGIGTENSAAVLEMGMSARGEISAMSRAVCPDIAVITNIGSSHLESLGTRENIARAKLEVLDGMRRGGHLLFDGDEPLLRAQAAHARGEILLHPVSRRDSGADFHAFHVRAEAGGTFFDLRLPNGDVWEGLHVPAPGEHILSDAVYAAGVGFLCGLDREQTARGLADYRPAAMRQTLHTVGGITVVEDCYNASPESVRAALNTLPLLSGSDGRRMALLGDMKELGTDTAALHRSVGAACAGRLDCLWTVGALGAEIAAGARDAGMSRVYPLYADGTEPDAEEVASGITAGLASGDVLLIKASRAMRLETAADAILRILAQRNNRQFAIDSCRKGDRY